MIKIVYDIKGLMIVCHCDSSLNKIQCSINYNNYWFY